MIRHIARSLSGIALVALTFAISACESNPMGMDGQQGVPLTDLDLGGTPPDEIALLGPDTVRVVHGSALSVVVDADLDLRDHLRFVRKNGKLGIGRQNGFQEGVATITVTVPAVQRLTLAGSGALRADALAGDHAVATVAGSGRLDIASVEAGDLKVEVLGSGMVKAAGRAQALTLTLAGSGRAQMDGLKANDAHVDVAGTGQGAFASDGTVDATIMGSGSVHVAGRATCKVRAMGSGTLVCEP